MTLKQKLSIYAGIVVVLFGAYEGWAKYERDLGKAEIRNEQSEQRFDSLLVASKRLDKTLAAQKQTVTLHATKYKTLRDTLKLTDTVAVAATLAQADTTIKACVEFMNTCELVQSNLRGQVKEVTSQRDYFKKQIPGKASKLITAGKWLLVGFVAGNLVTNARR